jgi:hypothetical protein
MSRNRNKVIGIGYSWKGASVHLIFFTLFLIGPTLAFVRPPEEPFFALTRIFVQDTMANLMLLFFFYFNYYFLIPEFYFHRKYVTYVSCIILFIAVTMTVPHLVGSRFFQHQPLRPFGPLPHIRPAQEESVLNLMFMEFRRHLYLFFSTIFFSFLLRTREHLAHLKEERLEAQLSKLQAQINPHFLFNTLNSIYALSVIKDDRASEAITNLAGLMRYVIKDANDNKICLQKEIDYLTNYIELQKARLGQTAQVEFQCSGDSQGKSITPLVLITYIENAFKYGVNPDVEGCVIQITLRITETGLRLETFNKKVGILNVNSTGIGMKNTCERLKHLYPERYDLQIVETDEIYSVTLTLELL